ncbi:MAG: hypothetical protein H0W74_13335 [Sphingosinicella sp.]|nr:hypothetical protein [Sphingosinicella sp.]
MAKERIVAIGLLTSRDVEMLGDSFNRLWPVEETPCFSQLIQAIDEAERDLWRDRDKAGATDAEPPLAPNINRNPA